MSETTHEGGCLCGAVRYRLWGAPMNVRLCHCRTCQRAMGSPFFARVLMPADQIEITGETARFDSSALLTRVFCPACGTRLFARGLNDPPRLGVALATLDDPNAFSPECHIFVESKLDWVVIDDGLPQHQQRPPA